MNYIENKFGFKTLESFFEISLSFSNERIEVDILRNNFAIKKGFSSLEDYINEFKKELNVDFNLIPISFEKNSFLRDNKTIYFDEQKITVQTVVYIDKPSDLISHETISKEISGLDLLENIKTAKTMYPEYIVFKGEISYNKISKDKIDINALSKHLNSFYNFESNFSDFIDFVSSKVDPGYIMIDYPQLDSKKYKGFFNDIELKSKIAIIDIWCWGRVSWSNEENKQKNINFRKKLLEHIILDLHKKN